MNRYLNEFASKAVIDEKNICFFAIQNEIVLMI